ncbi:ATP-dependent DNA helicase II subunit 1 [Monosporozyma servazzii]
MNRDNMDDQFKKLIPHEAIVFCIELNDSIFNTPPGKSSKSYLLEILESLLELMTQLVIIKPDSGIACFLYHSGRENCPNGIYELVALRNINITGMKRVSDLIQDVKLGRYTLESYFKPSQSTTPLEKVFTFVQEQITKTFPDQSSYTFNKVFLFTNNDTPTEANDQAARSRLKQITADLYDENFVSITTFFFEDESNKFDTSFYSDILNSGSLIKNGKYIVPNVTPISIDVIRSKVLYARDMKRLSFRCPLIISEEMGIKIGIRGYNVTGKETPGSKYKLVYEHDNIQEEAFSSRKYLHPKTAEIIPPSELHKVYQFGDINIELDEKEESVIDEVCGNKDAQFKLIGFRSEEKCVHYFNNIDKSVFIYPDEEQYIGSAKIFTPLFKRMRTLRKVALIWGKPRSNGNAALYILSPSTENDRNEGLFMFRVPFVDEMRKIPDLVSYDMNRKDTSVDNALFTVTEAIVNNFTLRSCYNPGDFKNPALHKFYDTLHDYLLQQEGDLKSEKDLERLVQSDDTLKKLKNVRDRIVASSQSANKDERKLSQYFEIWNQLYERMQQRNTGSSTVKKVKKSVTSLD